MYEKLGFWIPATFCAVLALITVVGNLILDFVNGTSRTGLDVVFYCFLPVCFYFVGMFLSQLRKDNIELRQRIDELTVNPTGSKDAS